MSKIHDAALAKAGSQGTIAIEDYFNDCLIALDELNYTSLQDAYQDGIITLSELHNFEWLQKH